MNRFSLEELRKDHPWNLDLFVCSASFEQRCLSVGRVLKDQIETSTKAIIVYNEDFRGVVQNNLDLLKGFFQNSQECPLRTYEPLYTFDSLVTTLESELPDKPGAQVGIDITTFTRESLLMLFRYLHKEIVERDVELRLFYNPADAYDFGDERERTGLSEGIREVRSVLGYPGNLRPSRETHLILMAGFEHERAVQLAVECEPSLVSLGIADPKEQDAARHQESNERCTREIRNFVGEPRDFTFSGYDFWKCARDIATQTKRFPDMNTIVAPMNTKISTVGAGLAGLLMPEVQLCYAQADVYHPSGYSQASEIIYMDAINRDRLNSQLSDL